MLTYNHRDYIADAIEGVLAQKTNFEYELIVGEDCSVDGTREIVSEYQRANPEKIRIVTSDSNVGMQMNILRIQKASRGKYIAFCEGDDFWNNIEKLQIQVDYLETHQDCGLVHGDIDRLWQEAGIIERNVNATRKINFTNFQDPFGGILLGEYVVFTCTVCVRKSLLDEVFFKEGKILTDLQIKQGDLPRWLYIASVSKVKYLPINMATYRILKESASHSNFKSRSLVFSESSKMIRKYFAQKYNCSEKIRRVVNIKYYEHVLNSAYHNSDKKSAKVAFGKLNENRSKITILQKVYLLGSYSLVLKGISIPFVLIRRFYISFKKRRYLLNYGERMF